MSLRKRNPSRRAIVARTRLEGMRNIKPKLDLGTELTDAAYEAAIVKVETAVESYNTYLTQADGLITLLKSAEKELGDLSQRMLSSVGSKFGYNSAEYKMAGGTPKGEKKRTARRNGNSRKAA